MYRVLHFTHGSVETLINLPIAGEKPLQLHGFASCCFGSFVVS
jgi:hypothetical protein